MGAHLSALKLCCVVPEGSTAFCDFSDEKRRVIYGRNYIDHHRMNKYDSIPIKEAKQPEVDFDSHDFALLVLKTSVTGLLFLQFVFHHQEIIFEAKTLLQLDKVKPICILLDQMI